MHADALEHGDQVAIVTLTLPYEINPLAWRHPALIYRLLFKAASQTLLEIGRNPRWLGGDEFTEPDSRFQMWTISRRE